MAAAWRVAAVGGALLTAAYFVVSGAAARDAIYTLIGLAAVACVAAGVWLHRPVQRAAWMLISVGLLCFVLGDGVLSWYDVVLHREAPYPSLADALYLSGYPFLLVGVARLARAQGRRRDIEDRLDAAIVTVGSLALLWHFLMHSYAGDQSLNSVGRLVAMAYPIMDIGILFIVVSTLVFAGDRRPTARIVALALTVMMIADLGFDLLVLHGAYQGGDFVDAGWLINYVLIAVAALHPSMADQPQMQLSTRARQYRPFLISVSGAVAPAILLLAGVLHSPVDVPILAGFAIVVFALVTIRVSLLVRHIQRQAVVLGDQAAELRQALLTQQTLESDLRYQAFHDALTGLANRALFHDRVEHALGGAVRDGLFTAVLFCDLDGFKAVNDGLGHSTGDEVLIAVATRLNALVRESDTVARLGGDEFAVLMESVGEADLVTLVAQRIVTELRQPLNVFGYPISLSASVGIAMADGKKPVAVLLSEADAAMYAAKLAGKDRVETFEESMRTTVVRTISLRSRFAEALHNEEFYLVYQPLVALDGGMLEGFEALVRWQHPEYGEIGPEEFIPLAEETGFIVPLGRWILETACAAAMTWTRHRGPSLSVSVNVSAKQLENTRFVDDVRAILGYSHLEPDRLVLEVTETMLVRDHRACADVLHRLKALGLRIAIDDFGTGYASLSYLRNFPVDAIKIDKSFVDPLLGSSLTPDPFLGGVIRFAHELQLVVVAEGIEHTDQRDALIALGCDHGQGYLISRPLRLRSAVALAEASHNAVPLAGLAPVAARRA